VAIEAVACRLEPTRVVFAGAVDDTAVGPAVPMASSPGAAGLRVVAATDRAGVRLAEALGGTYASHRCLISVMRGAREVLKIMRAAVERKRVARLYRGLFARVR
jgi:hypothetical protein